ncbi:MAG TPA: hypothetical protein VML94_00980 [Thermoplasmata archaeon]|nr:hypothetical protein [Thermoplasmata archaeon]
MLLRTFLSFVNLGVLFSTLAVWTLVPAVSTYALYFCLVWVVLALSLMYSPWGNRPIGRSARAGAGGSTPLVSGAGGPLDFCIFCAATLPAGATRCPACGHALAAT